MSMVHALASLVQERLPSQCIVNNLTDTSFQAEFLGTKVPRAVVFRVCRSPDTRLAYPRFTIEGVSSNIPMTKVWTEHAQDVVLYFCKEGPRWYFIDFRISDYPLSAYVWDEQGKVNRIAVRIPNDKLRQMFVPVEGVESEGLLPLDELTERENGSLRAVLRWHLLRHTMKGDRK